MWGNIILEATYNINFNFGFPDNSSDMLLNLTHWQYWWWFWFNYFLVLYYLLALRILRYRVLKFNPKIVTSFRAHGKWGDLLVCFIPVSWCLNILSNSNLLLRVLEWQGESGLMTIRVRGKQWYWVYKFEIKNLLDTFNTSKNVGYDRYLLYNYSNIEITSFYTFTNSNRLQSEDLLNYWNQNIFNVNYTSNYSLKYKVLQKSNSSILTNYLNYSYNGRKLLVNNSSFNNLWSDTYSDKLGGFSSLNLPYSYFTKFNGSIFLNFFQNNYVTKIFIDFLENYRHYKVSFKGVKSYITLKKFNNSLNNYLGSLKLVKVNKTNLNKTNLKLNFLVLKQKRYSGKFNQNKFNFNKNNFFLKLKNQQFLKYNDVYYSNFKVNLYKYNNMNNNSILLQNKRLLRVKRILVLPANLNINVITNSFDVVHSWYIPGLGVKLDCVPGRSTHHNIYINQCGFYYGQCAEICGRYHHHMPIRICSLPFEHFLIWWYNYSINIYTNFTKNRWNYLNNSLRFYVW